MHGSVQHDVSRCLWREADAAFWLSSALLKTRTIWGPEKLRYLFLYTFCVHALSSTTLWALWIPNQWPWSLTSGWCHLLPWANVPLYRCFAFVCIGSLFLTALLAQIFSVFLQNYDKVDKIWLTVGTLQHSFPSTANNFQLSWQVKRTQLAEMSSLLHKAPSLSRTFHRFNRSEIVSEAKFSTQR